MLGMKSRWLTWITIFIVVSPLFAQNIDEQLRQIEQNMGTPKVPEVPPTLHRMLKKPELNRTQRIDAHILLGDAYTFLADYDSALSQYNRAVVLGDTLFPKSTIEANRKMGQAYEKIGNYSLAISAYIDAFRLAETFQVPAALPKLDLLLGGIYQNEREMHKARRYYSESRKAYVDMNNDVGEAQATSALAGLLLQQGKIDSAEAAYSTALTIFKRQNLKEQAAQIYDKLGFIALQRGQRAEALQLHQEALVIRRAQNNLADLSNSYVNISNVYLAGGKFKDAIEVARKGVALANQTHSGMAKLKLNRQLFEIFRDLNYTDSALHYHLIYTGIKDSLASVDNRKLATRLRTQFEASEKQKELGRLREINLAKDKVIEKQRYLTMAIGIICLLLGALVFIIYNRYRLKQRAALAISQKNHENELLLKELHHRVKNNLQFIASMISIQRSKIAEKSTRTELKESLQKVQAMAMVHNKLYRKTSPDSHLSFKAFLQELTDSLALSYGIETNQIRVLYGWKRPTFDIDTYNALGLIINEMVTNSVKHCDEDHLEIKMIFKENRKLRRIIYTDNGPGINGEMSPDQANTGTVLIGLLADEMNGHLTYAPCQDGERGIKIILDLKRKNHGKPTHSHSWRQFTHSLWH